MQSYVLPYGIALVVFLVLDAIWLSTASRSVYVPDLKSILLDQPNFIVAIIFYALFVAGLVFFVIAPGAATKPIGELVLTGAFFGLVAYATYDLTNLATLKHFTVRVAVIDMVWGSVLSASVVFVTVMVLRKLGRA